MSDGGHGLVGVDDGFEIDVTGVNGLLEDGGDSGLVSRVNMFG